MALTLEMVDGLAVYGPATGEALPGVVIVHGHGYSSHSNALRCKPRHIGT